MDNHVMSWKDPSSLYKVWLFIAGYNINSNLVKRMCEHSLWMIWAHYHWLVINHRYIHIIYIVSLKPNNQRRCIVETRGNAAQQTMAPFTWLLTTLEVVILHVHQTLALHAQGVLTSGSGLSICVGPEHLWQPHHVTVTHQGVRVKPPATEPEKQP